MIEQVEHSKPHLHLVLLSAEAQPVLLDRLNVERIEAPKSRVVSRADKFTSFVHNGVRKSGVNVQNGHHCHLPRRIELSPRQKAVGRVEWQRATSIRPDHRLRIVSEVLV